MKHHCSTVLLWKRSEQSHHGYARGWLAGIWLFSPSMGRTLSFAPCPSLQGEKRKLTGLNPGPSAGLHPQPSTPGRWIVMLIDELFILTSLGLYLKRHFCHSWPVRVRSYTGNLLFVVFLGIWQLHKDNRILTLCWLKNNMIGFVVGFKIWTIFFQQYNYITAVLKLFFLFLFFLFKMYIK